MAPSTKNNYVNYAQNGLPRAVRSPKGRQTQLVDCILHYHQVESLFYEYHLKLKHII